MRYVVPLFIAAVALAVETVAAQDPWLGQPVFWKDGARAKVGTIVVDIGKIPFPATVGKVEGDWLWLGRAWVKKSDVRRTDEALAYYTEEIRRKPSSANAWNSRGSVGHEKGEVDSAIKDYTEAIRLDPADAWAYGGRGSAWHSKQEYDKAIEDHTEAIRLDPAYAMAYNSIAWLKATCPDEAYRDGTVAVAMATKANELTAWTDHNKLGTLAAAYAESGDFAKAVEWQEKALDLAPEDEKADFRSRLELYQAGKPYREEKK